MDIGREIKQINSKEFELRLRFRTGNKILHSSERERGKILLTNIDEVGKIYLPKEVSAGSYGNSIWGFITLSLFGHLVLFRETAPGAVFETIYNRADTRVAVDFEKTREKVHSDRPVLNSNFRMKIKSLMIPVVFIPELVIKSKTSSVKFTPSSIKEIKEGDKVIQKRNRLTIHRYFLKFIGVDVCTITDEEIVLFVLSDQIEIWERKRWERNVGKTLWSSQSAKYILFDDGYDRGQKHAISPLALSRIKDFISEEKTKRGKSHRLDEVKIVNLDYFEKECRKIELYV